MSPLYPAARASLLAYAAHCREQSQWMPGAHRWRRWLKATQREMSLVRMAANGLTEPAGAREGAGGYLTASRRSEAPQRPAGGL